jgi:hypothetical protein
VKNIKAGAGSYWFGFPAPASFSGHFEFLISNFRLGFLIFEGNLVATQAMVEQPCIIRNWKFEIGNWKLKGGLSRGYSFSAIISLTPVVPPPSSVRLTFALLFQLPRVKSGTSTDDERCFTDFSLSGATELQSAAS